jgi:hypothetical protein
VAAASGLAAVILAGIAAGAAPDLLASSARRAAVDTRSGRVSVLLHADRYAAQRDDYARAAAAIQPGSKVLAAVDVPSLLLSQRWDVNTIDLVGSTSPSPPLPYFEGTEAKLRWLRAHGYQYIVATDPDTSQRLYSRPLQEQNLRGEHGQPYQDWAPYYLDWFQFLDDVSSSQAADRLGSLIIVKV